MDAGPIVTGAVGLSGVEEAFAALEDAETQAKILIDPKLSASRSPRPKVTLPLLSVDGGVIWPATLVRSMKKRASRMSGSARREQLLDVTTRLIGERGFHDLSIEAVAGRAGVTRATVYQHFADQQQLLSAVIERETTRALAQVSETALEDLTHGDPVELMLESLRAYLHIVQDHPATWGLILTPQEGAPEALHRRIASGKAEVLEGLTTAVQPALALDQESPDAELTARLLSAISDEYARLVLADPERFPPERLLRHARWYLRKGAAPRTSQGQMRGEK